MVNKNIIQKLEQFMTESNIIEGFNGLNPLDSDIAQIIWLEGFKSLKEILGAHQGLTRHLNVDWSGKWRSCNVRVGNYYAPDWTQVPSLMTHYWNQFSHMDSYEAHNRFVKIHPMVDYNGRIARLIWLSKAKNEGYDFSISFLHKYYYQTLQQYE